MEAAFFDLDKTVIDRASIMAFAGDFRREGLLSRRSMLKGAWTQLVYVHAGASSERLEKVRREVLACTRGWYQAHVRAVVTAAIPNVLDPITYTEATELISRHQSEGRRVYLVSAAPAEIVEPVAQHLGIHRAVASVARIDRDGRYTGELERYVCGPAKADALREMAKTDGIDLAASFAYSDSATDIPMLELVGHAVAVNPDRDLRRAAQERGWEIVKFSHLAEPEHARQAIEPARRRRRTWALGSLAAAVAAAGGGATAVAWRTHRSQLGHA